MPLQAENKSYAESMQNLKAALNAGKIDLKEYNAATEKMALEHQNNLAKINAQAAVNPVASARAEVDPVQQLVNENNQKLALLQQYQQQEQAILQQSYQKENKLRSVRCCKGSYRCPVPCLKDCAGKPVQ